MTILLLNQTPEPNRIIFLLGEGLIGSAIVETLTRNHRFVIHRHATCWDDAVAFERDLEKHIAALSFSLGDRIDWIWSAGKSGFYSTQRETNQEWLIFRMFLNVVKAFESKATGIHTCFHLVSSAGGLFEGQRVTRHSIPDPSRPYGKLKLDQEQEVKSQFPGKYDIYRPSTVYSKYRRNKRSGLVSTLLRNLYTNKVTTINGHANTLRDFVWIEDVADFIAKKVWFETDYNKTYFLVAGKPTSIYEIIESVQRIANTKLLFCFNDTVSNAQSIVFDPSLRPTLWRTTNLTIGVRKVKESAMSI